MLSGILNICKPRGISSFKALNIVKRRLNLQKVGHLGTLDPAACGVLVLLVGKYTKRADELHAATKTYRSVFRFGVTSESLDCETPVTKVSGVIPTQEHIKSVLPSMIGEIEIEVPKFSAVHIKGTRAYELARKGIEFTAPKKNVTIKRFELLGIDDVKKDLESIGEIPNIDNEIEYYFEIECQTGTYIRSLAKQLAERLGTTAIASVIIRTKVGSFTIEDAKNIEEITTDDLMETQQ